jgi:hypothetical protein
LLNKGALSIQSGAMVRGAATMVADSATDWCPRRRRESQEQTLVKLAQARLLGVGPATYEQPIVAQPLLVRRLGS